MTSILTSKSDPSAAVGKAVQSALDTEDRADRARLMEATLAEAMRRRSPAAQRMAAGAFTVFLAHHGHATRIRSLVPLLLKPHRETAAGMSALLRGWGAVLAVGLLGEFPDIPRQTLLQRLDEVADCLDDCSLKAEAVLASRAMLAVRLGDPELAKRTAARLRELRPARAESEKDDNENDSDEPDAVPLCAAFWHQLEAECHLVAGDSAAALAAAAGLIDGSDACDTSVCAVAPRALLGAVLQGLRAAGNAELAEQLHVRGLDLATGQPGAQREIGFHASHLAATGRAAAGLELVMAHCELARAHASPFQLRDFLHGALDCAASAKSVAVARAAPAIATLLGCPRDSAWREASTVHDSLCAAFHARLIT